MRRATRPTRVRDKKELAPQYLLEFFRSLICPTGALREFLSSLRAKNIFLPFFRNMCFDPRHPVPHEGRIAIVRDVGVGCGGRSGA
jgi:hypothetical protein